MRPDLAGPDSRRPTRPRRAWAWLLAGSGVLIAADLVLRLAFPSWRLVVAAVSGTVVLAGLVALVVGLRWYRPAHPLAWWLLVAGFVVAIVAEELDDLLSPMRFPSSIDAWFLLEYALFAAGMLVMARARIGRGNRAAVLDALIVTIALGLVALRFVVFPYFVDPLLTDRALSLAARAGSVAYLVGDLLLLAVAVLLVAGGPLRPASLILLLTGVALQLIDDTVTTAMMASGGGTLGVLWLSSYACMGAAALHPGMRALTEPVSSRPPELGRLRVAVLVGAVVVAPVLVQAMALAGHPVLAAIQVGGTVLLAFLVYVRISHLSATIKRLLDQAVRAREDERLQVAAELHDGPIQRLTVMGLTAELALRSLHRGDGAAAGRRLEQIAGELGEEVMTLRRVMVELRPPVLEEWGLTEALLAYAADFQRRTGIRCMVQVRTAEPFDRSRETIVYRVTQEALTNLSKHARAANAWIVLTAERDAVELSIRDDGVGFDPATLGELLDQGHFGLAGIRRRVELGGGTCDVRSRPGAGTLLTVRLPAIDDGPARPRLASGRHP